MAALPLTSHSGGAACPVCGGTECAPAPTVAHLAGYPFLPGGIDPLSTRRHVIAPHRIVDHELGRVLYGTGDRVPWADAVKYGLVPADEATRIAADDLELARAALEVATSRSVDADLELDGTHKTEPEPVVEEAPPKKAKARAKKGPVEDRARKPSDDR